MHIADETDSSHAVNFTSLNYRPITNYNLGILQNPVWIQIVLDSVYFKDTRIITLSRSRVKIDQVVLQIGEQLKEIPLFDKTTLNAINIASIPKNVKLFYRIKETGAGQQVRVEKFQNISDFYLKERLNRSINWINLFFIILMLVFATISYKKITKEFYLFTVSLMFILGVMLFVDSGIYKYLPIDNIAYPLSSLGFLSLLIFIISLTRQISDLEGFKAKKTIKYAIGIFIALTITHLITPYLTSIVGVILQAFIILVCAYFSFMTLINPKKIVSFRFAAIGVIILCLFSLLKMGQAIGLLEGWIVEISMIAAFFSEVFLWSAVFFFLVYKEEIKKVRASIEEKSDSETTNKDLIFSLEYVRQRIRTHADETLMPSLEDTMKHLFNGRVQKAVDELDRAITTVRYLSRLYIKPNVKEKGAKEEILRFINLVQGVKEIQIHLDYDIEKPIASEYLQINLYRIVQEAINNTITHSNADTIFIQILSEEGSIYINAEDNGTMQGEPEEGSGIKSLRARLSEFNYFLRLSLEEGIGCRLEIEMKNVI